MKPPPAAARPWLIAFGLAGLASVLAQLFVEVKPHFPIEGWFGFGAIVGFAGAVGAMVASCLLGMLAGRPSDDEEG
jgi:hypothetical protein